MSERDRPLSDAELARELLRSGYPPRRVDRLLSELRDHRAATRELRGTAADLDLREVLAAYRLSGVRRSFASRRPLTAAVVLGLGVTIGTLGVGLGLALGVEDALGRRLGPAGLSSLLPAAWVLLQTVAVVAVLLLGRRMGATLPRFALWQLLTLVLALGATALVTIQAADGGLVLELALGRAPARIPMAVGAALFLTSRLREGARTAGTGAR